MRSNQFMDNLESDFLYRSLVLYRGDIRAAESAPFFGAAAIDWARKTVTQTVLILARRGYQPANERTAEVSANGGGEYVQPRHGGN